MSRIAELAELVRRRVQPGRTTLGQLSALLKGGEGLRDSDVAAVDAIAGKVPVHWVPGRVVAVSLEEHGGTLYLLLDTPLPPEAVAACLRGENDEHSGETIVCEAAVVAGN